ncbi:MAG: hypothetical protein R3Y32_01050 [Bacillota bacterium]
MTTLWESAFGLLFRFFVAVLGDDVFWFIVLASREVKSVASVAYA